MENFRAFPKIFNGAGIYIYIQDLDLRIKIKQISNKCMVMVLTRNKITEISVIYVIEIIMGLFLSAGKKWTKKV